VVVVVVVVVAWSWSLVVVGWSWVVGRGCGSWVVGRASWVVVVGHRWSTRSSVVGRRSWVVDGGSWAVVGRRLSMRSVGCRSSVVGRGSWVVGRGLWVVGRGSWLSSRGSSDVGRGRGLWVVGRGSVAWVPWVGVVGRGRCGGLCVGRGLWACCLVPSLVLLQSPVPSLAPSQPQVHSAAWSPTLALALHARVGGARLRLTLLPQRPWTFILRPSSAPMDVSSARLQRPWTFSHGVDGPGLGLACAAVAAKQSLSKKVGKMRTSSRAAEDGQERPRPWAMRTGGGSQMRISAKGWRSAKKLRRTPAVNSQYL